MIDEHLNSGQEGSQREVSSKQGANRRVHKAQSGESVQDKRSASAHLDSELVAEEANERSNRSSRMKLSRQDHGMTKSPPRHQKVPVQQKRWERIPGFVDLTKQLDRPDLGVQDHDPNGNRFIGVNFFQRRNSPTVHIGKYSKRPDPCGNKKPLRKGTDYYDVNLSQVINKANLQVVNMAKTLDRQGKRVPPHQDAKHLFGQITNIVGSIGAIEDPMMSTLLKQNNLLSVLVGVTAAPPAQSSDKSIKKREDPSVLMPRVLQDHPHQFFAHLQGAKLDFSQPQQEEPTKPNLPGYLSKMSSTSRESADYTRHGVAHKKELFLPVQEEEVPSLDLSSHKRSLNPLTATSKKRVTFEEGVVPTKVIEELTTN